MDTKFTDNDAGYKDFEKYMKGMEACLDDVLKEEANTKKGEFTNTFSVLKGVLEKSIAKAKDTYPKFYAKYKGNK